MYKIELSTTMSGIDQDTIKQIIDGAKQGKAYGVNGIPSSSGITYTIDCTVTDLDSGESKKVVI